MVDALPAFCCCSCIPGPRAEAAWPGCAPRLPALPRLGGLPPQPVPRAPAALPAGGLAGIEAMTKQRKLGSSSEGRASKASLPSGSGPGPGGCLTDSSSGCERDRPGLTGDPALCQPGTVRSGPQRE